MDLQSKLNKKYGVKTVSIKVEDIDSGSRKVKGYFSAFDTKDSDGDVIRKGAFSQSIKQHGPGSTSNRRVAHLRNHDWGHQIGKLEELYEDQKGLGFVSTLGRSTKGEDALLDYQDGIIREHSIGFNYVKGKIEKQENDAFGEFYNVTEVKLWEGSAVTFGANSLTPVIDVAKGLNYDVLLEKINSLTEGIQTALKNGKGTDERLENIELMFAQLQELQNSLKDLKPSKDTLVDEPTEEQKNDKLFTNLLKIY